MQVEYKADRIRIYRLSTDETISLSIEEAERLRMLLFVAIAEARGFGDIEPAPTVEPGSFKNARGILPWSEGDEKAEGTIRRMCDGKPAESESE